MFSCTLSYYANKKKALETTNKTRLLALHHILQQLIWSRCQHAAHCYCTAHAPCHECTRPPKQTEFPAIYPGNATGQFSVRPWRVGAPAPRACPQFLLNTIKKNLTDAAAQAQPWVDAVQGVALSRRCCSRHQQAAIRGPLRARTFADQILLRWKKPFFASFTSMCNWACSVTFETRPATARCSGPGTTGTPSAAARRH